MSKQPRWIDKSEGRFSSLKSPKRSILRTTESPERFNSPLYSQNEGIDEVLQRKVSFAPDANFRLFNQTDSPSAPTRFDATMMTEEMHFTDSIQNLLDEDEPTLLRGDIFDSPSIHSFKRPFESPTGSRKRRPDIFGSPSAPIKSPSARSGGAPPTLLNRVPAGDLTDYLPDLTIKKRRNIFEEDDDEEEEEAEEKGKTQETGTLQETDRLKELKESEKSEEAEEAEEETHHVSQDEIRENINSSQNDMVITQETPLVDTQENYTSINRHISLMNTTDDHTGYSDAVSMMITQEYTRNYTSQESPVESPVISPITTPERSPLRTPERTPVVTPHKSPFGTPYKSPQRSPFRMPSESPQRPLFGTPLGESPKSVFEGPLGSPARIQQRTPLATSLGTSHRTPLSTPQRIPLGTSQITPLGTPQRTPRHVIQRTPLYLPATNSYLGSPIRSSVRRRNVDFSPKSFLSEHSINLDNDANMPDVPKEAPHFYDPKEDISIHQQKITLSEYLRHIGITFPKDLPVRDGISDYDFQYDETDNQNHGLELLPILPELYLYQQACDQLIASIKKSDDIIDKIDREVSATNPQLFTEYIDGSVETQMKIRQQLVDMKKYSLLRAEQEWISLCLNKLQECPITLKTLQNKLNYYYQLETFQAQKLDTIKNYRDQLKIELEKYRKKEQDYNATDHEQLSVLKQEIENQGYLFENLKNEAVNFNVREKQLTEIDMALDEEIRELNQQLQETEQATEKNLSITSKDLVSAANDWQELSDMFKWKLRSMDGQLLHLEIGLGIDIFIDLTRLTNHASDAVTWKIAGSLADDLGPMVELLQGFGVIVQNRWDPKEILQDMTCFWNSIEIIKRQIDRTQRRSWINLTTLEQDPFGSKLSGFACDICLFSFKEKLRVDIRFEIKVKDVFNLPNIDLSTLSVKTRYSNIEHDIIKKLIIQELTENGIIGLDQSLENVLNKVTDLQKET